MNNTDKLSKNSAIGRDALEFMDALLTSEEIAESNLRVAIISERIKTRTIISKLYYITGLLFYLLYRVNKLYFPLSCFIKSSEKHAFLCCAFLRFY